MQRRFHGFVRPQGWLVGWSIFASLCQGCERRGTSHERYVPDPAAARDALAAALDAWQTGQSLDAIHVGSRSVRVIDTHRKPDQRLQRYEVLGEVPGDGPRCFSVQLTLANPSAQEKVRFVLVGVDPLWVFREEDYTMIAHWDHPMPSESEAEN